MPIMAVFAVILCFILEFTLFAIFYGVYSETIALLSDVFLSELPLVGPAFAIIDDEITVAHLIAMMLAFVSCYTPIYIWSIIIRQQIHLNPQAWLAEPGNQIIAAAAGFVFVLVFAVEAVNLYTLIARESGTSVFATGQSSDLMRYLAANKGLAIFVSVLVAVINAIIGFFAAHALHGLKKHLREMSL
jgi:ABC-type uncharacterized transport system permease subunit